MDYKEIKKKCKPDQGDQQRKMKWIDDKAWKVFRALSFLSELLIPLSVVLLENGILIGLLCYVMFVSFGTISTWFDWGVFTIDARVRETEKKAKKVTIIGGLLFIAGIIIKILM